MIEQAYQFIIDNRASFLVNTVTSLFFLLLGYVLGIYPRFKDLVVRHKVRSVWGPCVEIIFYSGIKVVDTSDGRYIRSGDYHGTIELRAFFQKWFPRTKLSILDRMSTGNYTFVNNLDLVLVGGPHNNELSRLMLEEQSTKTPLPFTFEGYSIRIGNGSLCELSMNERQEVIRDYGIVYKFPNPWNGTRSVFLLAGLKSFGTLAAIRVLTELQHNRNVIRRIDSTSFCLIVRAIVEHEKLIAHSVAHVLDVSRMRE